MDAAARREGPHGRAAELAGHPVTDPGDVRALWVTIRQALLLLVDGIERFLDIRPRTAELRRAEKQPERSA